MRMPVRLRRPNTTVRWRLTLLYGGLFLVCGVALLAITYTLVSHATISNGPAWQTIVPGGGQGAVLGIPSPGLQRSIQRRAVVKQVPPAVRRLLLSSSGRKVVSFVGRGQRISDLHQLVIESAIALAIMAIISGALGWLVAGRVLRPLRTMTAATREISEANLHHRLAMAGPQDELRELADTIDGLLGRLQGAFDTQRRFVANASHELRTPLTASRALLELVISDPDATVDTYREACRAVLEEGERQEDLIDALLELAQGQRGLTYREPMDLAEIARGVAADHEAQASERGLQLDVSLLRAPISGDRRMLERLVSNLIDNAVRHNEPNGRVGVTVVSHGDEVTLAVVNTGPVVAADDVTRLVRPFERLATERTGHGEGLGLGLSIVAAIADAHGAQLEIAPRAGGGLSVEVRFVRSPGSAVEAPLALRAG
jgi:signal transduction histidine kinase